MYLRFFEIQFCTTEIEFFKLMYIFDILKTERVSESDYFGRTFNLSLVFWTFI